MKTRYLMITRCDYLVSAVRQHRHHAFVIGRRDEHIDVQLTFTLVRLLGQDMSRVRVSAFDLAGGGQAESLCRTFMCF